MIGSQSSRMQFRMHLQKTATSLKLLITIWDGSSLMSNQVATSKTKMFLKLTSQRNSTNCQKNRRRNLMRTLILSHYSTKISLSFSKARSKFCRKIGLSVSDPLKQSNQASGFCLMKMTCFIKLKFSRLKIKLSVHTSI
jgi:hypothetical protein